jgi:hypothetical protein
MAFWDYSGVAGSSNGSSPPPGSAFSYGSQGVPNYGPIGASLPGGPQFGPGAPFGYANPFDYNSPNMFSYNQPGGFNYNQPGGGLYNQIANDVQRFQGGQNTGGQNTGGQNQNPNMDIDSYINSYFTRLFGGEYSLAVPDYILNSDKIDPYGYMAPPPESNSPTVPMESNQANAWMNNTNDMRIPPTQPQTGGPDTFQQLTGNPPPPKTGGPDTFQQLIGTPPPPPPPPQTANQMMMTNLSPFLGQNFLQNIKPQ